VYFNSETAVKFLLNFLLIGAYTKIDEMGSQLLLLASYLHEWELLLLSPSLAAFAQCFMIDQWPHF